MLLKPSDPKLMLNDSSLTLQPLLGIHSLRKGQHIYPQYHLAKNFFNINSSKDGYLDSTVRTKQEEPFFERQAKIKATNCFSE